MKRTRILIFEPFGNLYGSERSLLELIENLDCLRFEVFIYCPRNAPWISTLDEKNLRYFDYFEYELHNKTKFKRLYAFIVFLITCWVRRIDLIHVNQAGAGPYAIRAGNILNVPVVLHSRWHEDAETIEKWDFNTKSLSSIVAIGKHQQSYLERNIQNKNIPIKLIRNPFSIDKFKSNNYAKRNSGVPVFICPARLHAHKRQDLLMRATKIYREKYGELFVHFFGEEEQGSGYRSHLVALAEDLGVSSVIKFHGFSPHWHRFADQAVAVVLPSDDEALGRVIFEAWGNHCLPLAWKGSGGPAEVIGSSKGGVLYGNQTAEDLSAAMRQAVKMPEKLRSQYLLRGKAWVEASCDPREHARRISDCWQEALDKNAPS